MSMLPESPVASFSVDDVATAAIDLITSKNEQHRRHVDKYLRKFRSSRQAWTIGLQLLSTPTNHNHCNVLTHFGAGSLLQKIRHDLHHELSFTDVTQLMQAMVRHLKEMYMYQQQDNSARTLRATVNELAAALAALFAGIQGFTEAPENNIVEYAIRGFTETSQHSNSNRTIQIGSHNLPLPNEALIPCVISILKEIPREADELRNAEYMDKQQRQKLQTALDAAGPAVMQLLETINPSSSVSDAKPYLKGLTEWITYGISATQAASSRVLQIAFEAIKSLNDDLIYAAVELIQEAVDTYTDIEKHQPVILFIVPRVMQLQSAYDEAIRTEDYETVELLTGVFSMVAETYVDLIVDEKEIGQMTLVQLLLRCSAYPDVEIASKTLRFWFALSERLRSMRNSELRQRRLSMLHESLLSLVTILTNVIQFPEDFDKQTADRQDRFKHDFRYEIADLYLEICEMIGSGAVLELLATRLDSQLTAFRSTNGQGQQENVNSPVALAVGANDGVLSVPVGTWQGVEGTMYAIRSIARYVPVDEDKVLPILMQRNVLESFPPKPEMRATIFRLVGRYASWLRERTKKENATKVTDLVALLVEAQQDIAGKNPLVVEASCLADALKNVCTECSSFISSDVVHKIISCLPRLPCEHASKLVNGITSVALDTTDDTNAQNLLQQIAMPYVQSLQEFATSANEAASKAQSKYKHFNELQQTAKRLSDGSEDVTVRIPVNAIHNLSIAASESICDTLMQLRSFISTVGRHSRYQALRDSPSQAQSHPVVQIMTHIWPILDSIGQSFSDNEKVSEYVCRLYKDSVRTCRLAFAPLLEKLVMLIVARVSSGVAASRKQWESWIATNGQKINVQYQKFGQATQAQHEDGEVPVTSEIDVDPVLTSLIPCSYIHLASVVVHEFGSLPDAKQHLVELVKLLTSHIADALPSEPFPPQLAVAISQTYPKRSFLATVALCASTTPLSSSQICPSGHTLGFAKSTGNDNVFESKICAAALRVEQNHDLFDDWFRLIERALQSFPLEYLQSSASSTVLQYCFAGLKAQHRNVNNSVFLYILKCLRLHRHVSKQSSTQDSALAASIEQNMLNFLPQICDRLFAGVAHALPSRRIDDPQGSIAEIFFDILSLFGQEHFMQIIEHSFSNETIPSQAFTQNTLQSLKQELVQARHMKEMEAVLLDMASACDTYRRRLGTAN